MLEATLVKHFTLPVLPTNQKWSVLAGLVGVFLGLLLLVSPWLGLLGVLGALFVLVTLNRPIYLCYMVLLATVFTSGMERGKLIPLLVPNEPVLILAIGLAIPAIFTIHRSRNTTNSGLITTGIIVFSAGISIIPLLVYFVRGVGLTTSELFSLVAPLQYILVYLVFRYLPVNSTEVRSILRLMLISAAIVGIVGLLQAMRVGFVLDLLNKWYPSHHEEEALSYGRVSSVLGAWNSLGTFLILNIIVLRAISIVRPPLIGRLTFLIVGLSCVGCLLASGSYASIVGLVVGLLLFEFFDPKGGTVIVFFFLSVPVLAFLLRDNILARFAFQTRYGNLVPQTLLFRFWLWKNVFWPVIQKNWLWGFHPIIPSTLAWQYAESQYITLWLRSGIFSLLAHLLWVSATLMWLYRNICTSDGLRRSLSISAFVIIVILSIMGLTNAVFNYSSVSEYLWIMIGLTGALGGKE